MATKDLARACECAYHFVGDLFTCAYCGDLADTEDHTVPSWYVAGNMEIIKRVKLYKVAACRDCNLRASKRVDRTFSARKARIAKSIRHRFRFLLGTADWTQEELEELGPRLRDYVLASVGAQRHLLARLDHLRYGKFPQGMPAFFFSGVNSA